MQFAAKHRKYVHFVFQTRESRHYEIAQHQAKESKKGR
jgi:hypothetical protein